MNSMAKCILAAGALAIALAACGGGDDEASNADINGVAGSSAQCNNNTFPDLNNYNTRKNNNAGDIQCLSQLNNSEALRQAAIANCQAGDATSATANYNNYKKTISLVSFSCK